MTDFEKLGVFYLGRLFDLQRGELQEDPLLYDSKDLTTHALCVGMTGSGKTGLCLSLLEEAAIDGIPAIIVDPKGDLGNLLLTFPELTAAQFQPWVDPAEAVRNGETVEEYARQTAEKWQNGLAKWGQDGARIARFRDAVDIKIYTPGSNAGLPLTVLRSFDPPSAATLSDADAFRERVVSAASGLLGLLGLDADPIRSREHLLLSTILDRAWREGRKLDMASLVREIQQPPFTKIGVVDLESAFPTNDRFAFSMQLNNLLASPGFSGWLEGEPLEIQQLLYLPDGKPRLSIISIAHLSDPERMFFVTTLLNELVSWMRAQSGTSSLRAIFYMDEVFGYFPPTANPPSKQPMLTLLKQARAFGLGVVLATQNPVDLDYKGLGNCGTWFLGRLQTERDKARVLEGLEGASAAAGRQFDRQAMEQILSGLGSRTFLINNVHEDVPVVFQSRWALSYLRGPLTRAHIQTLMQPFKSAVQTAETGQAATAPLAGATATGGARPLLPPAIDEVAVSIHRPAGNEKKLVYRPALFGRARVHYVQTSSGIDQWEEVGLLAVVSDTLPEDIWAEADRIADDDLELDSAVPAEGNFAALPAELALPKNYTAWKNGLKNFLFRSHPLRLHVCPALKEQSKPGETDGEFRVRLRTLAAEARDLEVERLRKKYAPKLTTLQDRLRRAEAKLEQEKSQASQQTLHTVIHFGTTVLGALLGRKMASSTNMTRAATSVRSASKIAKERADIDHAEDTVESVQKQLAELEEEFEKASEQVKEKFDPSQLALDEITIAPRKADLSIDRVALAWTPWLVDAHGIAERAF